MSESRRELTEEVPACEIAVGDVVWSGERCEVTLAKTERASGLDLGGTELRVKSVTTGVTARIGVPSSRLFLRMVPVSPGGEWFMVDRVRAVAISAGDQILAMGDVHELTRVEAGNPLGSTPIEFYTESGQWRGWADDWVFRVVPVGCHVAVPPARPVVEASGERVMCADCDEEITGTDDGTGQSYCPNCDEGKDDEHVVVASGEREAVTTAHRVTERDGEVVVEPPIRPGFTIYIDRRQFAVRGATVSESDLRSLPSPPIPDDSAIWLEQPNEDVRVGARSISLRGGERFYTKPNTITAGADGSKRPRTYEERYGHPPLEQKDDVEEMRVALRAALATSDKLVALLRAPLSSAPEQVERIAEIIYERERASILDPSSLPSWQEIAAGREPHGGFEPDEYRVTACAVLDAVSGPPNASPIREALDNLTEALDRVSYDGEAGDVEDVDQARHDATIALATPSGPPEDGVLFDTPALDVSGRKVQRVRASGPPESDERGFVPTSAERALVGQLRTDVEVEREGRHLAEDLLQHAITSLRSIASADPKSDQARWMVEEAKRGIPKGAEPMKQRAAGPPTKEDR